MIHSEVDVGMSKDPRSHWNRRYRDRTPPGSPAPFLTDHADRLPDGGRALDLAGGGGRHAVWLARQGFEVTMVDASDEACSITEGRVDEAGVTVRTLRGVLGVDPLPTGPFAVVLSHLFLDVEVWRDAAARLAPGGVLLIAQPTVRNLERHDRPPRSWLLDEGQLGAVVAGLEHLEVVELSEGWTDEDRHEARAVLRRPVTGS